ncbi:hypothetical protein EXIGLDRAFT_313279 [Exidia glandulosa HHB12029]|uniref:F-box domain-containing protein n=1 Tax=Exidia glandulosa HHB12029 TaxID=1314781 RepID=A0A165LTE1_EXIGL|nr:hypothetical protein EXIGLDRAFT_313279 [Exidia glandulosa HHB12029]
MASLSCLPPELLAAMFFFLDLPRLLVAGSVCTLWRTLALDCRAVWHDIYVDLSREHAWTWCQRRIDLGGSRVFSLDIHASGERLVNFDAALDTLSSSMYRISQLRIKLDQGCAEDLWKALRVPAPELTVFRLEIHCTASFSALTVPSNIFDGVAPRLDRVHLISIVLPDSDIPAFARVRAVAVISPIQAQRPFPLPVFRCFPAMESLQVAGGRMVFDAPPPQRVIEGVARLRHLDIDYAEEALSVFSCLPVAALPSLLFAFPTRDVVYAALETLKDPLQLFLYRQDATEFRMTVTSSSTSRTFAESFSDYEEIARERNVLFDDNAFAERLMSMMMATSLWTILTPFLPSFDQLAKFSLLIDDPSYDAITMPLGRLLCPKLTTLELIAKYSFALISTQQLVDFAAGLTSARLCLELYHVVLVGRTPFLEDRFNSISVKDQLNIVPTWGQNYLSDR